MPTAHMPKLAMYAANTKASSEKKSPELWNLFAQKRVVRMTVVTAADPIEIPTRTARLSSARQSGVRSDSVAILGESEAKTRMKEASGMDLRRYFNEGP